MVASMGGIAGGQFLLGTGDPATMTLFLVGGALVSLAMTSIGPEGFCWTVALAFTAIGLFALVRLIIRPKIKGSHRSLT